MELGSVEENQQVDFNVDEPEIFPRVGDKYQAEIPPLSAISFYDGSINHTTSDPSEFLMGLPIPVMRIYEEVETTEHDSEVAFDVANKNGSSKSKCVKQIQGDNSKLCAEPMDIKPDQRMISSKAVKLGLKQKKMSKMPEKLNVKQYSLVPGSSVGHWSDIEKDTFLLGLYIFGKNLVQVKKFIGSKQMGDILSFYYGEFYRSCSYIRWNKCKRVLGERLFTGSRQKVLLSRLLPQMSEEDQTTLVEVSRTFQKKRMLLEEYVFIIKAKVGLSAFVQAVGIGKEKQDLTVLQKIPAHLVPNTRLAKGGLVPLELKATMTPTEESKMRKKRGADKVPQAELRRHKKVCAGPSAISSELKEYAVIVHAVPPNSQPMDAPVHRAEERVFSLPAPNSNDIVTVEDSEMCEETVESGADTGPMITPEAEIPDQVAEDIPILYPSVDAGGINPERAQATDQINPLPSAEPQTPISHQVLRATSPSGPALSTCENLRLILDQPEVRESAHVCSARNTFRTLGNLDLIDASNRDLVRAACDTLLYEGATEEEKNDLEVMKRNLHMLPRSLQHLAADRCHARRSNEAKSTLEAKAREKLATLESQNSLLSACGKEVQSLEAKIQSLQAELETKRAEHDRLYEKAEADMEAYQELKVSLVQATRDAEDADHQALIRYLCVRCLQHEIHSRGRKMCLCIITEFLT